ncbi:MAG TPA: tetratricopeptide repeat protein [Vicinamibacterales bacterium]|nr:tetratricopeptide repeat protein [Vicinamibacterales bacterium]
MFESVARRALVIIVASGAALSSVFAQAPATSDKLPITTKSDEARKLYVDGRDLLERLRGTDGRRLFEQAVGKDPDFALAHVGLANTAGTNREFVDAVTKAVALADKVSEGERHQILALDAALKGDPAGNLMHVNALVRLFPNDERAHTQLGVLYFGRQDYPSAIAEFEKSISINPKFSPPYNQLGYAYRFTERFNEAETAFKKYTQLIPDDPNPYDSYAELLMKIGRFDESIKAYEKALSIDPNFVNSYVGIGNDYLAMGKTDQARAAFAKIGARARNTGERRLVKFWTAASYVHEGATDKAIDELKAGSALAEAEHDAGTVSGDLIQIGDVLREAGRLDDALAKYGEAVKVIESSQLPEPVKAATRRNHVFEEARIAVAKHDLATAKSKAAEYVRLTAPRNAPFELRQQRELAGLIALAEKRHAAALEEFTQANQRDPRVLLLMAEAAQGAGSTEKATALAQKAAHFNELSFNFAYVKKKAERFRASSL